MIIKENMAWPPMGPLEWKMAEHSAWYSGDAEVLANFYTEYASSNHLNLPYLNKNNDIFWGRQIKNQGEIFVHVPIAGDIAETSGNLLFGESPTVKIAEAHDAASSSAFKEAQSTVDDMLMESGFFRKILEAAETAAAIGGVFIKIAWDDELSPYPIPVVVQADRGIPEFRFGMLVAVTFWSVIDTDKNASVVYRMTERYERGRIVSKLYKGTADRLGWEVSLAAHKATANIEPVKEHADILLSAYIPNKLPNRLDRMSSLGRSDYSGIEGLMDSLDEAYSSWVKDIAIAQGKIHVPESWLSGSKGSGFRYNLDKTVYVQLDIDPTTEGKGITATQFAIRADEFEKSTLNLLDRIVSSAGYSPQSFGLSIEGRAESGTALAIRERKSFATKVKKENYWQEALQKLVTMMIVVYAEELGGQIETDITPNIAFNDGFTNNINELANSVKLISDAQAASIETKVRILHPDWEEEQILQEVERIKDENSVAPLANPDMFQMGNQGQEEDE